MNIIKIYKSFIEDVIGLGTETQMTFVELYKWAKRNGCILEDIDECSDKLCLAFVLEYESIVFQIELDFTKGREGEIIIDSFCDANYGDYFYPKDVVTVEGNEIDWAHCLNGGYALNTSTMEFENCSGIKMFFFVKNCDVNWEETHNKSADYICYDHAHNKLGYVYILD